MSTADRSIAELLASLCDETISPAEMERLDRLLCTDAAVRRLYLDYLDIHARLSCRFRPPSESQESGIGNWEIDSGSHALRGNVLHPTLCVDPDDAQRERCVPTQSVGTSASGSPEPPAPAPEPLIPPIIIDTTGSVSSPLFAFPSSVGGWLFSYAAATVITGMAILGAWTYKVSHESNPHVAAPSPAPPFLHLDKFEVELVGRITGTADCRWADPQDVPTVAVPLGRKYALISGLVEISYDSGAKVILQGPCTYEVESRRGGFLSLGKLTAKVEESSAISDQLSATPSRKTQDLRPKTEISKFVVRTPTAVVTDLGTEFGVEVAGNGTTTSHVFRGSVRLALAANDGPDGRREVVLRENESARVEKAEGAGGPRFVPRGANGKSVRFVRRLVEPPKTLDLLDIVAGGNGTGHRREHGVNLANAVYDYAFLGGPDIVGDHQYHFVSWHTIVDGVFVPDGSEGPVQVDSAGHKFAGFPATSNTTYGSLWSRAATIAPENSIPGKQKWFYALGRGGQFMPQGRGLLCMNPNKGISFNLATVRQMHSGARPARFRATAGMADSRKLFPDTESMASFWVLLDGRLKLSRPDLRPQDGPFDINVAIGPDDRFLTLAVTDSQGHKYQWPVFGDPVIELAPIVSDESGPERDKLPERR